jgi:hypothetical protein
VKNTDEYAQKEFTGKNSQSAAWQNTPKNSGFIPNLRFFFGFARMVL